MTQPLGIPSFGAPANPLQSYLRAAQPTDAELRSILRAAAEEAERLIPKELERLNYSGKIKAAQLTMIRREIHQWYAAAWGDIGKTLRDGVANVSRAAYTEAESLLMDYMARQGIDTSAYLASLRAQAARGLPAVLARAANGIPLSRQVYKTQALARGLVDRAVNNGLLLGHSAQRVADSVRDLIDPNVPGGVSYAAMRLARTELNNAFKTAQEQRHADEPWVKGMQWHLSGSHPRKDECNLYAEQDIHDLGAGIYPVGERPHSHPNCLCFMTVEQISEDEWIDRFIAGEYDEYLDEGAGLTEAQVIELHPKPPNQEAAPAVAKKKRAPRKRQPKKLVPLDINEDQEPEPLEAPIQELPTGEAAQALVPKGLFKRGTLTPAQRKALKAYETSFFRAINKFARAGLKVQDRDDERTLALVKELDGAMAESVLPEDIQVWRGMYRARTLFGDRLDNDMTGFSWDDNGFGSTTSKESVANDFSPHGPHIQDSVRMVVRVAKGTGVLQTSTHTEGSEFNGPQGEITLQRGMTWRVVKDNGYDANGVRQLEVEASPIAKPTRAGKGTAAGGADASAERAGQPGPTSAADRLRALSQREDFTKAKLSGGAVAETSIRTYSDGSKVVEKIASERDTKAEELASLVARALGINAPAVVGTGKNSILMDFLDDARVAVAFEGDAYKSDGVLQDALDKWRAMQKSILAKPEATRIALLDALIGNIDRHTGNWMVTDGTHEPRPIDHGFAWQEADEDFYGSIEITPNIFKGTFTRMLYNEGDRLRAILPFSKNDMDEVERRLEALRPDFERLKAVGWLEHSLKTLRTILKPRASGTRKDLIK